MNPVPPPSIWRALVSRRTLICAFTGFASGLPLWLLLQLLPAWFRSDGVDLKTIGLFTLTQAPYSWKFLWSPLIDRYAPFRLGRRRGWMLVTQVGLLAGIGVLGHFTPHVDTAAIFGVSLVIALLSATQDIAIDAFRREILPDSELGLGNAVHVNAYKVASLIPGSLSLILADTLSWVSVFWITALFMLPAVGMTLWVAEPNAAARPLSLRSAVVDPFKEFLNRSGWRVAATLLAFMLLFRVGDALCQSLATPFYLDMGYSKTQVGLVAKHAGLWPAVIGGMVGGLVMVRIGINRALWVFGASQIFAILGFAYLASFGPQEVVARPELLRLAGVIATEYLATGLCTAAFVAFIAQCAHPTYTATQLALFSSLMSVPRALVSASSGFLVAEFGWVQFYLLAAALSLPGMFLLLRAAPWNATGESPKWAAVES